MASVIVFLALTAVLISSNANVNSDEEGEENMEVCPALEANPETSGDHENPKRMAFALGEVTFFLVWTGVLAVVFHVFLFGNRLRIPSNEEICECDEDVYQRIFEEAGEYLDPLPAEDGMGSEG